MLGHMRAPGSQEWDLGRHRIASGQCRCCLEVMSRTLRNHESRLQSVRWWQWFLLLTTTRIPRLRRPASPMHVVHPRSGCHVQHCFGTSPARTGYCSWEWWLSCIPDDGARSSHGQRPRPCSEGEQYRAFLAAFFVQPVAEAHPMQGLAQCKFRLGVLSPDPRHALGSIGWGKEVDHAGSAQGFLSSS